VEISGNPMISTNGGNERQQHCCENRPAA